MANFTLFVSDTKSKYRRKFDVLCVTTALLFILLIYVDISKAVTQCGSSICEYGECVNETCVCDDGWHGPTCAHCVGRVRLTADHGFISDGSGNYSVDWKCAWLVDTGIQNRTIRFRLDQFATECGWDHIFIHDGGSAFSPITAAYSGRMVAPDTDRNHSSTKNLVEVSTSTGKSYIHFYSDAAYNISGFNVSYRFGGCDKDCSGHGVCDNVTEICLCDQGWTGTGCDEVNCSHRCSEADSCASNQCSCQRYPNSSECLQREQTGYWRTVHHDNAPNARTSHRAVVSGDSMWVVGGYNFDLQPFQNVARFDFIKETWEHVNVKDGSSPPEERYGHTLVEYQDHLYMFGGVVENNITMEVWIFNMTGHSWRASKHVTVTDVWHLPIAVTGHSAHVVNDTMVVIFGHSPKYGYMHQVQEFNFLSEGWKIRTTTGALVKGTYGHSSVYDQANRLIYVFGGSSPQINAARLTDHLYRYNTSSYHWSILKKSRSPRYLHSAIILNGLMIVFGGNTHNDTSGNHAAKCYSPDFMAYDIGGGCDRWSALPQPDGELVERLARYGHSAVIYNNEMYVFGGFSGVMLNDLFKYTPGNCSKHTDEMDCEAGLAGVKCSWLNGQCVQNDSKSCLSDNSTDQLHCAELRLCSDCLSSLTKCVWCENKCSHKPCDGGIEVAISCPIRYSHRCNQTFNCELCKKEKSCTWKTKCAYIDSNESNKTTGKCSSPCTEHTNCSSCAGADCMWCTNQRRCVETNSYAASFPYGTCMEWTTTPNKCPETMCENLKTCAECNNNPRCGWCKQHTDTGLGQCLEGGDEGPIPSEAKYCHHPDLRWHFTSCPLCQCNGHSTCHNGTSTCVFCENHTTGSQCELCEQGYFGNPKNGGRCERCNCNEHADLCDRESGKCHCRTKGVIGDHCSECDSRNKYFGNPSIGTCYYDLATDYQYTFNLSKETDTEYTQINFMNIPGASDRDVDFTLNCSGKAMINITWLSKSHPNEEIIIANSECRYFKIKFEHKSYSFGSAAENTTFRVYVYDFNTPFWLQLTISQQPHIDLAHFFVTFFSCFLSLMLIAALLWKIKQRYDLFRRRQRMFVEMEQMASRPFAGVSMEIEPKSDPPMAALAIKREIPDIKRKKTRPPNKPAPIACEPLFGNKMAVLTLLVRLPTGDEDFTPPGQSGLAVASALVTVGSQRKPSLEHNKGDKSKKKHTHPSHPDTCI